MASTLLLLVLYTLSVARVTRVITTDKVMAWWRNWLITKRGTDSMLVYLNFCRWCMSIWVAFALAPAAIYFTHLSWWLLPGVALSASHVTGLLTKWEANE